MREIKFRGKRVDCNEWVHGFVFKTTLSNHLKQETVWILTESRKYKVTPESVGQYTGRKDFTRTEEYPAGKDLYGGDIIKSNMGVSQIIYDTECAQFTNENGYELYLHKDVEKIGNISENPELLEKTKWKLKAKKKKILYTLMTNV